MFIENESVLEKTSKGFWGQQLSENLNSIVTQLADEVEKKGLFYNGKVFSSESYNFLRPVEILALAIIACFKVVLVSGTGTGKSTLADILTRLIFAEKDIGKLYASPGVNESVLQKITTSNGYPEILPSQIANSPAKIIEELNRALAATGQPVIKILTGDAVFLMATMNPKEGGHYTVQDIEPSILSNLIYVPWDRAANNSDRNRMKLINFNEVEVSPVFVNKTPVWDVIKNINLELNTIPNERIVTLIMKALKSKACHQYLPKFNAHFNNSTSNQYNPVFYQTSKQQSFIYKFDGYKPEGQCVDCGCTCSEIGAIPDNMLASLENTARALAVLRHFRRNEALQVNRNDFLAACELFIRKDTVAFKNKSANERDVVMNYIATLNNSILQFEVDFKQVVGKVKAGKTLNSNEMSAVESFSKTVNPSVSQAVLEYHTENQNKNE